MPFLKLQFKPGVNRDTTNYSGEGNWWEMDKIRFLSGFPQKLGGWVKATPQTFLGTCRWMWNWITTFGDNLLALGTDLKLYLEVGGYFYDITPLQDTTTSGSARFLAVSGSSTIIVSDKDADNVAANNFVTFSGVTTLGGNITAAVLDKNYQIQNVIDAQTYTITTTATASASDVTSSTFTCTAATPAVLTFASYTPANNDRLYLYTASLLPAGLSTNKVYYVINAAGATCQLSETQGGTAVNTTTTGTGTQTASLFGGGASTVAAYEIDTGTSSSTYGYGWGTGTWNGSFGWGLSSPTPVVLPPRLWWYDNFDNDLVANIEGGSIYYWERGSGPTPVTALATRAVLMQDKLGASYVPVKVTQVLVSQQNKILISFGSTPYGSTSAADFDPLLIRWGNQDDPLDWTQSPTNSAGDLRVSRGSRIVRAIPTRQEILVFTDSHLFTLQFTGTTDVFALQEYADNISIAGARSVISANNITFWMGQDKFYAYTGRVETLPTTLRNQVFGDINLDAGYQIIAGTNEGWNEVWWIYPSADSNVPNRYVIFNYNEKIWYYGNLRRTGWLDSPLRNYPIATQTAEDSTTGYLYYHENGVNDDTLPMESYILSNDFDLGDGDRFMLTKRILPDITFQGSTANEPEVQMQLRFRNFPGTQSAAYPTDQQRVIETSVNNYTDQIFVRARGRQMAMKVGSTDLGVQWQLGSPRLDATQDGKR